MRHRATVSCALLLLCGCGDMPSRDATAISPTFPAQWTSHHSAATNINPQWLNAFADATLTPLVNDALTHNYDLKAAAARVNAARQQAIIDGADRLPQLALSPNYQRGNLQNTETTGSFNVLFDLS